MPELIVDDYRRQKETWEIELALAHSDELATELRALLNSTDKMHLVSQLQKHEALIEFIQFDQFNFAAVPSRGEKEWLPARYVAVVIRNREEQPFMIVDLGEVNPINQLIVSYRNLLIQDPHSYEAVTQKEQRTISGRHLRLVETTTQEDSAQEVGIQLRRLLFDPLRVALGDCRRLLIAPDGELAVIPFEILPTDTGNFLIDTYAISYLSTGREQLRQRNNRAPVQPPLVVANPDYNLNGEDDQEVVIASPLGQQSRDLHNSQPYFFPLVGTADEGKVIAQLLDADTLFGAEAQKGTIKAIRSPQILHIATHGFFLPNQVTLAQSADGITMQIDGAETNWAKLSQIENSLLRSGLALAGANQWLAGNKLPEAAEDGLLTAEDVVSLNLTGTELVVLSACETGLGEIRLGEGVYGLRRAFALAGVNTLLMSLWKVPDLQTKELMVDFYQRLLAGESRLDALRAAQLRIKTQYPHPLYWGAFIMQGEPGPITLLGK